MSPTPPTPAAAGGRDWSVGMASSKFWSQLVKWPTTQNSGLTTTTVMDGNEGRVMSTPSTSRQPINNLQRLADVILLIANSHPVIQLEQIAPGRYQGKFAPPISAAPYPSPGRRRTTTGRRPLHPAAASLLYPPEYRDPEPNVGLMHVGRRHLPPAANSPNSTTSSPKNSILSAPSGRLWEILLIVSCPSDVIAWRRLNIADWSAPATNASGLPVIAQSVAASKGGKPGAFRSVKSSAKTSKPVP